MKIFSIILLIILVAIVVVLIEKEIKDMAMIYVSLIIKGKKTFSQVPDKLKPEVRQILIGCDCAYLIEE